MNALRARLRRFPASSGPLPGLGARVALSAIPVLAALYGCTTASPPPPTANEALPANLQASADEVLQEVVTTSHGDENYICRRTPPSLAALTTPPMPGVAADGTQLLWAEVGSESMLVDADGEGVGTVAPAYHFLAYDGSYVVGTPGAEAPVKPGTLTWARYVAKFVAGPRPGEGRFANVSSIQRIDTTGGMPAQPECTQEGEHLYVPFTATYMIYRTRGEAPTAASTMPVGLPQPLTHGEATRPVAARAVSTSMQSTQAMPSRQTVTTPQPASVAALPTQ